MFFSREFLTSRRSDQMHRYRWGDETIETNLSEVDAFVLSLDLEPTPYYGSCPPLALAPSPMNRAYQPSTPTRIIIEKRHVKSRIPDMPFAPENVIVDLDETVKLSKIGNRYHLYPYGSDCRWHDIPVEPLMAKIIRYFYDRRRFPDARTNSVTNLMKALSSERKRSLKSTMNAITEVRSICRRVGCMEILRRYSKGIYGLNRELDCCVAVWRED